MKRARSLPRRKLAALTSIADLPRAPRGALLADLLAEASIREFAPDGRVAIDPRDGVRIVFAAGRAKRPRAALPPLPAEAPCPVCEGRLTRVVDVAPLPSGGVTFVNKNLYPIVYANPHAGAHGAHFLQWTSLRHDEDLDALSVPDVAAILARLAALERTFLHENPLSFAHGGRCRRGPHHGYFLVIKNRGGLVGGSLVHGHQQIVLTEVLPGRLADDLRFHRATGRSVAEFLLERTPEALVLARYEGNVTALVPPFMRRPLHSMLVVGDASRRCLHDLSPKEIRGLAAGTRGLLRAFRELMPRRYGKPYTLNMIVHNGPSPGVYFEFFPYTQEMGGYEHLGLFVCQDSPESSAAALKAALE